MTAITHPFFLSDCMAVLLHDAHSRFSSPAFLEEWWALVRRRAAAKQENSNERVRKKGLQSDGRHILSNTASLSPALPLSLSPSLSDLLSLSPSLTPAQGFRPPEKKGFWSPSLAPAKTFSLPMPSDPRKYRARHPATGLFFFNLIL
jgi:hypothetical protein